MTSTASVPNHCTVCRVTHSPGATRSLVRLGLRSSSRVVLVMGRYCSTSAARLGGVGAPLDRRDGLGRSTVRLGVLDPPLAGQSVLPLGSGAGCSAPIIIEVPRALSISSARSRVGLNPLRSARKASAGSRASRATSWPLTPCFFNSLSTSAISRSVADLLSFLGFRINSVSSTSLASLGARQREAVGLCWSRLGSRRFCLGRFVQGRVRCSLSVVLLYQRVPRCRLNLAPFSAAVVDSRGTNAA